MPQTAKSRKRYGREYAQRPHVRDKALSKYGITAVEYDRLLVLQHGACKLCFTPVDDLSCRLAVDHDHTTKAVRGLLCTRCNRLVGLVENNFELVDHILHYLR